MSRVRHPALLAPVGAIIGFLGAMCGIGGGLFAVPILRFGRGLALRVAVGSSLALVLATALASTGAELVRADSELRWELVLPLVAGALAGIPGGYSLSRRLTTRRLEGVFAVATLVVGLRMLTLADPGGDALAGGSEGPLPEWLVALLAGAGGGFLAPLLGVGGGLIFVPVLYLGIPQLSFGAARAASLAAAVVTASRSNWLYWREGVPELASAAPLAVGALVGAVLGVVLVHSPGWSETGRVALGGVLILVSLRFCIGALRGGRAQDASGQPQA